MEHDILSTLRGGDTTLAWLAAVALAAGGTAVVVALYLQIRRWRARTATPVRPRVVPAPAVPEAAAAATAVSETTAPDPAAAPAVGVAAYRAEQARSVPERPAPPDRLDGPPDEILDGLLRRLRTAAETLEEVALKGGRAAGGSEAYQAFLTGLDVEYLHRQG